MKQRLFQKIRAIFANAAPVQVVSFARPVGAYASWIGGASDAALDESYCRGAVVRVGWKDVETSPGVYSWTALDGYVNDCKSRGKKWTLAVGAGTPGCPQWVTDGASQTYTIYFRPQDNPDPFTIAAGWDTYYLSRLQLFMAALAARYGSDPDLQMVYVPQQTGNGIEGHFNANTDSSLTTQGINSTSWVQCSKQAAHIVAAAFPDKSVAFEVHKVISSHAIPMQIVEEMHAETSGQVGAAMWWLKGTMTEQSGLIDALYTYAGNIYAQPIGNSGDTSRFPTSADYLAIITQAMELGCRYVEFWDYEYLNDTFPTHIAQFNAWCDGSIVPVSAVDAVVTDNDVAITWTNPHVNDHSVIVQRNGSTIATLSSGSTSYSDNDLASGSYTYRVRIEQHGVVSEWVEDSVSVVGSGASGGNAALGWSAPGGLTDGQMLTITTDGTHNFGTKPNGAKPRFFFDWRRGTLASSALSRDSYNAWRDQYFEMQTEVTFNGGAGAAALKFVGENANTPTATPYPDVGQSGDKWYFYKVWKSNFTIPEAYARNIAWNLKWTRLYSNDNGQQFTPYFNPNGSGYPTHLNLRAAFQFGDNVSTYYGQTAEVMANTDWRKEEIAVKQSSANDVPDAEFSSWFEGRRWGSSGRISHTTEYPKETYPLRYASLVREQGAWADTSWRIFFDCWYIDDSWCRVLISDEESWSDAQTGIRNRYIQIPTAWSTNSITVSLREGGMGGFVGKYIYIIDSTGVPVSTTGMLLN